MRHFITAILIWGGVLVQAPLARATLITFSSNAATYTNVGGYAGLTLTITCGTTASGGCGLANDSTTGNALGVNSNGVADPNGVDGADGEYLKFTFSGAGYSNVKINSLNLGTITLSGGQRSGGYFTNVTTGQPILAESSFVSKTISISSNNSGLVFTLGASNAQDLFSLASIDITATATPEPPSFALVGLLLCGVGTLRRRAHRIALTHKKN